MLFDYKMTSATIGQIPVGQNKANEGKFYVVAQLKNMKNRRGAQTTVVIFEQDDAEFVAAVRSVFPATGNDPTGQPYHGTNTAIAAANFDMLAAMKQLENVNGDDFTLFPGAKNFDCPLPGKYIMTYATALNGNAAGSPVMEKNSNFVKVVDRITIFVMMYDEASEQYVEGWNPARRLQSRMNNLIPLEAFIQDPQNKAKVNPRDLGQSAAVPQDATTANAEDETI